MDVHFFKKGRGKVMKKSTTQFLKESDWTLEQLRLMYSEYEIVIGGWNRIYFVARRLFNSVAVFRFHDRKLQFIAHRKITKNNTVQVFEDTLQLRKVLMNPEYDIRW